MGTNNKSARMLWLEGSAARTSLAFIRGGWPKTFTAAAKTTSHVMKTDIKEDRPVTVKFSNDVMISANAKRSAATKSSTNTSQASTKTWRPQIPRCLSMPRHLEARMPSDVMTPTDDPMDSKYTQLSCWTTL